MSGAKIERRPHVKFLQHVAAVFEVCEIPTQAEMLVAESAASGNADGYPFEVTQSHIKVVRGKIPDELVRIVIFRVHRIIAGPVEKSHEWARNQEQRFQEKLGLLRGFLSISLFAVR